MKAPNKPSINGLLGDLMTSLLSRINDNLHTRTRPTDIPPLAPDCGWNHGEEKTATKPAKCKYGDIPD
jgi:hypothetical protein